MPKEKSKSNPTAAKNRSARFEFHILETYEAGLVLKGSEVKSIRTGTVNLKEGYAHVRQNELFLEGVNISPYSHAREGHDVIRSRKLLMHRKEIDRIDMDIRTKGLTLVPLRLYFKDGRVKLELGLAKGKQAHDKRASIKKKDTQRELARISSKRKIKG